MNLPQKAKSCTACPLHYLCKCLKVTREEVVTAISVHDLRTVREIKKMTGAGDGCTCCHAELNACLKEYGMLAEVEANSAVGV